MTWYPGAGLTYRQYLQRRAFSDIVVDGFSSQARNIIASNEELGQRQLTTIQTSNGEHIQALGAAADQITEGVARVSEGVARVENATHVQTLLLASKLESIEVGMNALANKLGQLNTGIEELLAVAKSPSHTWAIEQYDMARQAYKAGFF